MHIVKVFHLFFIIFFVLITGISKSDGLPAAVVIVVPVVVIILMIVIIILVVCLFKRYVESSVLMQNSFVV